MNYFTAIQFLRITKLVECVLKLNTMQLETPGGNHCCLMAIVYMADLNKILVHSFLKIKVNMYLYIFTATVITVYKHDKQKQLYATQTC